MVGLFTVAWVGTRTLYDLWIQARNPMIPLVVFFFFFFFFLSQTPASVPLSLTFSFIYARFMTLLATVGCCQGFFLESLWLDFNSSPCLLFIFLHPSLDPHPFWTWRSNDEC